MTLKIKLDENAFPLSKVYSTDAGYDLKSPISITLLPKSSIIINTGVHVQIPHEYAGLLVSKSGLNVKHDITSTGLIDEGYTGPIIVKLYNNGNNEYKINRGDKITQLVLIKTNYLNIEIVNSFNENENSLRGNNGFGSSGK
jgi:dUTP pyrophosphatase